MCEKMFDYLSWDGELCNLERWEAYSEDFSVGGNDATKVGMLVPIIPKMQRLILINVTNWRLELRCLSEATQRYKNSKTEQFLV